MTTPLLAKAISFAQEKHKGQTRKATGLPYITHLAGVATLVKIFKRAKPIEELVCAAYLHDTLEDTETTELELMVEFGPLVTQLVSELTSDKNEIEKTSKVGYLKKKLCGISSYALTLKLCDRLHNLSDNPTDKTINETRKILGYLQAYRKLNATQRKIVAQIKYLISYLDPHKSF